jgi:hypothetical protein
VAHRPHPVEAARQALDVAVGVLTGDRAAGTEILEKRTSPNRVIRRPAMRL